MHKRQRVTTTDVGPIVTDDTVSITAAGAELCAEFVRRAGDVRQLQALASAVLQQVPSNAFAGLLRQFQLDLPLGQGYRWQTLWTFALTGIYSMLPPNHFVSVERVCRHWRLVSRSAGWQSAGLIRFHDRSAAAQYHFSQRFRFTTRLDCSWWSCASRRERKFFGKFPRLTELWLPRTVATCPRFC